MGSAPRGACCEPKILLLLGIWYASSALTSLSTKEILRSFPHPVTLALVQQLIAASFGWASLRSDRSRREVLVDLQLHWLTLQISVVMVISLIAYRWALMGGSVAFINTVKTLGPVFVIVCSRVFLGERLSIARYLAVLPIILGVALTSITEAEFTWVGFLAGLVSTLATAVQSVAGKRLLREGEMEKAELFSLAALQACFLLLPLSLAIDAWRLTPLSHAATLRVSRWLGLNGVCFFVNQYVSLSVLDAMASPLSFSLASVMKRATVITTAMAYAARPVTPLHICGVGARYELPASSRAHDQYELVPLGECTKRLDSAAENSTESTTSSESLSSPKASPRASPRVSPAEAAVTASIDLEASGRNGRGADERERVRGQAPDAR